MVKMAFIATQAMSTVSRVSRVSCVSEKFESKWLTVSRVSGVSEGIVNYSTGSILLGGVGEIAWDGELPPVMATWSSSILLTVLCAVFRANTAQFARYFFGGIMTEEYVISQHVTSKTSYLGYHPLAMSTTCAKNIISSKPSYPGSVRHTRHTSLYTSSTIPCHSRSGLIGRSEGRKQYVIAAPAWTRSVPI